jgi:hypothetical protein
MVAYTGDDGDDDATADMAEEDEDESGAAEGSAFKQRITALLTDNNFISLRSSKLSVDDFLRYVHYISEGVVAACTHSHSSRSCGIRLLVTFNEAGIHFS